jgi:beta-hydroxylase
MTYFDANRFEFTSLLEANWRAIRTEYAAVSDRAVDWSERELYGEGWKVYGLFDFPHGEPLPANTTRCPLTADLVARHVPTHGAAGFSILKPGTRIQPHNGYPGRFLRCHLALAVPEGDCGLKVAGETRRWQEGKVLIFDDRVEHEAWNDTPRERVVLLIDFIPEERGQVPRVPLAR